MVDPTVHVRRVGHADLRLCDGPVPHYKQIVRLGGAILEYMVDELGTAETLRRFSNPLWFEAFACVVGFEWQFSGATTVTLRALRDATEGKDVGIHILGGKGKQARTKELVPEELREPDVLTTKVDSALVQDGYQIYFHSILYDDEGHWTVVNQGMNTEMRLARRYHWCWEENRYLDDAESIAGKREPVVLDLQTSESRETRKAIMDILRDESPRNIVYTILTLRRERGQKTLAEYLNVPEIDIVKMPFHLRIPRKVNEHALQVAKNAESFLDLLKTPGLGPATIRGLAYIAALVYGAEPSWRDPVRYTFAFGTKAGVPWMVEREEMERAAQFLKNALDEAKLGHKEKKRALMRLSCLLDEA